MKLRLVAQSVALSSLLALTACGSGGGGGSKPAPVEDAIVLSSLQGFWNGPVTGAGFGGADHVRSVVLENGAAWVFLHDAQDNLIGLSTANLSVSGPSFTGSGARYPSSGNAAENISVTGAGPKAGAWTVSVAHNGASSSLALSYDNRFNVALAQADATGDWHFTKDGGTVDATWSVAADGALSGTSTLGCTYSGKVAPHGSVAVFDVTITETCTSTVKQLSGIAKLNSDKTYLNFGLTTTDRAESEAFLAQKKV